MGYDTASYTEGIPSATGKAFFSEDYFLIPSILSFVSTVVVIIGSLLLKLHKTPLGIMILGINTSGFVYAATKFISAFITINSNATCKIVVFIGNISLRASILWGALFGHALLMTVRHNGTHTLRTLIKWYVSLSILIPFLFSALNSILGVRYDPQRQLCVYMMSPAVYGLIKIGPISLGFILSTWWYILAIRDMNKIMALRNPRELLVLLVFPMILVVCWLPGIIAIMIQLIDNPTDQDSTTLGKILQTLGYLQGFFDALVYGRSVNMIGTLCRKCKKDATSNSEQATIQLDQTTMGADQTTNAGKESSRNITELAVTKVSFGFSSQSFFTNTMNTAAVVNTTPISQFASP